MTHTHTSLLVHTSICNQAANLLEEHSRKILKRLESAWDKGSGVEEIFREDFCCEGTLLLERGFAPHWGVR
ncbi:hypothetical protein EMIT0P291_290044 [Pseudomonas sp. IT-P291]